MLRSRANVSDVAVGERVKCSARQDSGARLDEFPYRWKCLDDHLRSPPVRADGRRRLSVIGPDPSTSFIPTFRHIHPPTGPLLGAISHYLPGTSFGSDFQHQVPCRTEESTQSGLGQPRVDVWRARHKGGMDVAIRASRAERQDRGLRGEPEFYRDFLGIKIGMSRGWSS